MKVYIVAAKRTPIGSFGGVFKNISAPVLAAEALKNAIDTYSIPKDAIDEVFLGNVLQANVGQAPARQALIFAGLSTFIPATTINKVCASGLKAVQLAVQSIMAGDNHLVVAGGMENMSMVPHYLMGRDGQKLGNIQVVDGLVKDGLTDVYNQKHMGCAAELCAKEYKITREEQDAYAIQSYKRSALAWENACFNSEIAPVIIPQKKGDSIKVDTDEEFTKVFLDKIPGLKPVFETDGTVTAANASTINDGAAIVIVASEDAVKKYNLTVLAEVVSFADAALEPEKFTVAPAKALPLALQKSNLKLDDIDLFEINEAFSVVSLANQKLLNIPNHKINIWGGAVSLGHPLGASGARILVTLVHQFLNENKQYGAAAICNGGGGASAMVIKKPN
jgi:acetyl-CoA C-acetyltransferase